MTPDTDQKPQTKVMTKWDTIKLDRAEAKRQRRRIRRLTKGY